MSGRPDPALLAVVAIGALLRGVHLGDAPVPIADEHTHLELATNLLALDARVGAFRVDWFALIFHPPLFFVLGAIPVALLGESVGALRLVTALAGTASVALLYLAGRRLRDRAFGLTAAALYATFPLAVVLDRWAYAYPLVWPLALGALLGVLRFEQQRDPAALHAAALCTSAVLVTGYYAAPLLAVFLLYVGVHHRRHLLPAAAVALSLPALFALVFLLPRWEPVAFTLGWQLDNAVAWPFSLRGHLGENLRLVSLDACLAVGALGLLGLRRLRALWIVLGFLALSQYMIYRRPGIAETLYPAGAFLGAFALGVAQVGARLGDAARAAAARWMRPGPRRERTRAALSALALGVPLVVAGARLTEIGPRVLSGSLASPSQAFAAPPADVAATRDFLARHATPGDLVLGSSSFTVGLPLRRTDLMQTFVYQTGRGVAFYPTFLPARPGFRDEFFAFDASLAQVDWIVLAPLDWAWHLGEDYARRVLDTTPDRMRSEFRARRRDAGPLVLTLGGRAWPVAFRSNDVLVLRRPDAAGRRG